MNPALQRITDEALAELQAAPTDGRFDGKGFLRKIYRRNAEHLAESLFLNFTTTPGWDAVSAEQAALRIGLSLVASVKEVNAKNGFTDPAFNEWAGAETFKAFHDRLEALFRDGQAAGGVQ